MNVPNLSKFVSIVFTSIFIGILAMQKCIRTCKIFEIFCMKRYRVLTLALCIEVSRMRIGLQFCGMEKYESTMTRNVFTYFLVHSFIL